MNIYPKFDYKDMVSDLRKIEGTQKKRVELAFKNVSRNVPRVVGKEVSKVYNIAASQIYPPNYTVKTDKKTGEKVTMKKMGNVHVSGKDFSTLNFRWFGGKQSPIRFKMSPKTLPAKPREQFDVSWSYLRGQQEHLRMGKVDDTLRYFMTTINGITNVFYAKNNWRDSFEGVKIKDRQGDYITVPGMIENKAVNKNIYTAIGAEILKQLEKTKKM